MTAAPTGRTPVSTYRVQVREAFDLHSVAELSDYLAELGVDWVYLSPLLEAEPGSDHGYDVVRHDRVDPARGGDEGLVEASTAAHGAGLGVLVDIVPNHVGVATPMWFGTRSTSTPSPASCAARAASTRPSSPPRSGSTRLWRITS